MVSNATMGKIVEQFEKIIDRQAKEIDDLRNRLAAHTYTEYTITRRSEESALNHELTNYNPAQGYEPGTIVDDFPQR